MAPTLGHATRLGIGKTADLAAVLELDFLRCTMAKTGTHVQVDGIRGTRQRPNEQIVNGTYTVGGQIVLTPRPDELNTLLLEAILSSVAAGPPKVFTPSEVQAELIVDVEKIAEQFRYEGCKVNTATFRSRAGQLLELELDIAGKTETAIASFPAISTTLTDLQPYIHHNAVLTLGGTAYSTSSIEIVISHALILDRFLNSQTRTELPEGDLDIKCRVDVPFTATEFAALYAIAVEGIAGSVVYTNGNYSITIAFAKMQAPTVSPIINARGEEVGMSIEFTCRRDDSAGTAPITITNDATG